MNRALALIVLAACGAPPRAPAAAPTVAATPITGPIARDALPGLRWITPAMPWRTPHQISAILEVPGDPTAVLLSARSWLGVMDLSTGTIRTQRTMENGILVVQLLDGRLIAFSVEHGMSHGAFLDPTTLATTRELDLAPTVAGQPLDVVVSPAGDLIAALPGQPLAMLDTTTLKPVRELSPYVGTFGLQATSTSVLFTRINPNYQREKSTPAPGQIGGFASDSPFRDGEATYRRGGTSVYGSKIVAARGDTIVLGNEPGPGWIWKGSARPVGVPIRGKGALDSSADRFAAVVEGSVTVFSTRDGSALSTIPLGDRDVGGWGDRVAFVGDRLVVTFHGQVRVVDLAAKTVSPASVGPLGTITSLAVNNAGDVETLGHDHVLYRDGRAVTSEIIDGHSFATSGGSVGTYAIYEEDRLVSLKPPDYRRKGWLTWFVDGKHMARIATDTNTIIDGWSGYDALVLIGQPGGYHERFASRYERQDPEPRIVTQWNENIGWLDIYPGSRPLAIDPDSRTAVVQYSAGPRLVDLTTGTPTTGVLACEPAAELEHGGGRVALYDSEKIVVMDRETQKVLGSVDVGQNNNGIRVRFLPGREEVLIKFDDRVAVWSAAKNQLRIARLAHVDVLATSLDGHQLAIAFDDARVALVDFDAFLARLPVEPSRAAAGSAGECSGATVAP